MNTQNTLFYDDYDLTRQFPTDATAKPRLISRDKVTTERSDSGLPLTSILAYLLGLAAVAVTVVSGHFPWFLMILTLVLAMNLFFPRGHRTQADVGS